MTRLGRWLAHLEALHPLGAAGIELGLDRVRRVQQQLGQRQTVPLITVGGTNGKGSTCALLEAILGLKPEVLRLSLNREFLELKNCALKCGVLNPTQFFNKLFIERDRV